MQQRVENSKKPTKTNKKFIVVFLLLLAVISAWFSKDFINKRLSNFNFKSKNAIVQSSESSEDQKVVRDIKAESNLNTVSENQTSKLEPNNINKDQPQTGQDLHDNNLSNSHIKQCERADNDNHPIHVDNYRNYLANINSLLTNFLQDKVYSNQIAHARILSLPPAVDGILGLFEEYNVNYLVSPLQEYEKVFPVDHKILKKFIKIKKLTKASKEKKQLRASIISNLELFQEFMFSNELQKIFIGQKE